MGYLKWIVPITILYIMLTGNPEPLNWLLGLLIAVGVVALIRPNPTPLDWSHLPRALYTLIAFMVLLLRDLIASGIQVARLVLRPPDTFNQGIVAIPDDTHETWVTTLSAEAITLTPGEMVVEIGDDGTLYTHTLDVDKTLANSFAAQQKRARQLEEIAV